MSTIREDPDAKLTEQERGMPGADSEAAALFFAGIALCALTVLFWFPKHF